MVRVGRRGFLGALVAVPAAVKAAVLTPPLAWISRETADALRPSLGVPYVQAGTTGDYLDQVMAATVRESD